MFFASKRNLNPNTLVDKENTCATTYKKILNSKAATFVANFLLDRMHPTHNFHQSRHLRSHRCEYNNRLTLSCPAEKGKKSARK